MAVPTTLKFGAVIASHPDALPPPLPTPSLADETTSPAIGGTRTDSGKASSGLSACPSAEDARLQRPAAAAEIAETCPRMPKTMFKRGFSFV